MTEPWISTNTAGTTDQEFDLRSEAFQDWFLAQPGVSLNPDIVIVDYRGRNAGRGVKALRDIPPDSILFRIPKSSILDIDTSSLKQLLPSVFSKPKQPAQVNGGYDGDSGGTNGHRDEDRTVIEPYSWSALILVLIYEFLRRDPTSPWKPYLDILPKRFDTLMFWTDEELKGLKGCSVLGRIGKESADSEFRDKIIPVIRQHASTFFDEGQQQLSDEELMALAHRMGSLIMAYAFDVDDDDNDDADEASGVRELGQDGYVTDEDDEEERISLRKAMVPMADMLNADAQPNASLFQDKDILTMRSLRHISAGEEILNDYGQLPRAELLRRYGYITPNYAPFDCVEFGVDAVADAVNVARASSLESEEVRKRLEYLNERGIVEDDSFEIVWPTQSFNQSYFPLELIRFICALTATQKEYKSAAKNAHLTSLAREDIRDVLNTLLDMRLTKYTGDNEDVDEVLGGLELSHRHSMAVEIRRGEKKLLLAATESLNDGQGEPQSKRRRLE